MKKYYLFPFTLLFSFMISTSYCQAFDSGVLKIKYPSDKNLYSNLIFVDSLELMEDFRKDIQINNFMDNQRVCSCSFAASIVLKFNDKRFLAINSSYKNEFEKLFSGFIKSNFENYQIRKKGKNKNIRSYKNKFWVSAVLNLEEDANVSIIIKEFRRGYSSLIGNYTLTYQ